MAAHLVAALAWHVFAMWQLPKPVQNSGLLKLGLAYSGNNKPYVIARMARESARCLCRDIWGA